MALRQGPSLGAMVLGQLLRGASEIQSWGLPLFVDQPINYCGLWMVAKPIRSTQETRGKTIARWYLQGNHHFRVSWAVQDFVHPQQVPQQCPSLPFLIGRVPLLKQTTEKKSWYPDSNLLLEDLVNVGQPCGGA